MIDKLVEMSILSAPTKHILHGNRRLRSQLNTLIIAPYGSGKTTLSLTIEEEELGVRVSRYTEAAILGTIRKDGTLVLPSIVRGAGKLIMIDEFQNVPARLRDILLSLLEEQLAERELGYQCPPLVYNRQFFRAWAEGNWFKVKIRASYLITTMKITTSRYQDVALLSRCFPLVLGFTYEDAEDVVKGRRKYSFKQVKKVYDEFVDRETVVTEKTRDAVFDMVKRYAKQLSVSPGHMMRAYGDILRVANVISILDGYETVQYYEQLPVYTKLYFLSVKGSELGYREHTILSFISSQGRVTIQEVLNRFDNYSDTQVSTSLNLLLEKGLIKRRGNFLEALV